MEFGGSSFVKGQQCEVMCDLHMGWMEDEVEGEAGEEAGAQSRGEVMREGVLVVGGDGRRGACKMHPCWWRRREVSRMILGFQRWEICNQDGLSLVPSLCACVHACACLRACMRVHVYNGPELWALLTPYRHHGQAPLGIRKRVCSIWEDQFSWAQMCSILLPCVLPALLTGWGALPLAFIRFSKRLISIQKKMYSHLCHTHTHICIHTYIHIDIFLKH